MSTNHSPEAVAKKQKSIQDQVERSDRKHSNENEKKVMQAGAREYPEPPMPSQHLKKPGLEKDLELQPYCEAPFYKGSEKLKNKVAIITGGDSGIGRSVAILFAREGADVVICHLNEDADAAKTKVLVEKEGRKCVILKGDVSSRETCRSFIKEAVDTFGKLDILVNNAAFQIHSSFEDLTVEHFDHTLKTNLYGYFFMAQAAAEVMPYGGAIVNTGSVTGLLGNEDLLDYSMTKGGIHAFTRSLATHLINKGIRVNAVAPGPVWTPLNPSDKDSDTIQHFGESTPMGRPAQPEEIAPAYVFLASSHCSSYITGEILPIIGGYAGG